MSQSGLYVVATPIGNLEDISYRAVRILSEADLVAAEDTRPSALLLSHYGIKTPMQALHEHNEDQVTGRILERISSGQAIALISDAGTPLISDPGYRLVRAARPELVSPRVRAPSHPYPRSPIHDLSVRTTFPAAPRTHQRSGSGLEGDGSASHRPSGARVRLGLVQQSDRDFSHGDHPRRLAVRGKHQQRR